MTPYLVNPYSGVVHRPDCKHAHGCIPWQGYQATPSDKPCRVCRPDLGEHMEVIDDREEQR